MIIFKQWYYDIIIDVNFICIIEKIIIYIKEKNSETICVLSMNNIN